MPITKARGQMYENWVDYCWSPLVGGCQHQCSYCYCKSMLKRFGKEWTDKPHWASDLGESHNCIKLPKLPVGKIFVCHTTDMFADNIPRRWIESILEHCWKSWCDNHNPYKYGDISFVFQTKNPARLREFAYLLERFPAGALTFGITLETNRCYPMISNAPSPIKRANEFMQWLDSTTYQSFITIEPIMEFDFRHFLVIFGELVPDLVWIGADSKRNNLPEPSQEKVVGLITELRTFTEVRLKKNLNRLLPKELRIEKTKPS